MICPALVFLLVFQVAEDPAIQRGRVLYRTGSPQSGTVIQASMGNPPTPVLASALPCVGCHGRDGRGRAEGGLQPANITQPRLERPFRQEGPQPRNRPGYTDALLDRAILHGLDAGGNRLNPNMPRYQLSTADAADLRAYLKVLHLETDPGVFPDYLVLGVVLGRSAVENQLKQRTLQAYVDLHNRQGGSFGREWRLSFLDLAATNQPAHLAFAAWVAANPLFALVAVDLDPVAAPLARYATEQFVPVVGCVGQDLGSVVSATVPLFQLEAGFPYLVRALVQYAGALPNPGRAAVVHRPEQANLSQTIGDAASQQGWTSTPTAFEGGAGQGGAQLARALASKAVDRLFFLGLVDAAEEHAFFEEAARLGWKPRVLAMGPGCTKAVLQARNTVERVVLAFPSAPEPLGATAAQQYQAMAAASALPPEPNAQQRHALAACQVLQEALAQVGRELNREILVATLEKMYQVPTGYGPTQTFSPVRHHGSTRVYLQQALPGAPMRLQPVGPAVEVTEDP